MERKNITNFCLSIGDISLFTECKTVLSDFDLRLIGLDSIIYLQNILQKNE